MSQTNNTIKNQPVIIRGRKAAVLRNWGTLCDIRRHTNGFMYNGAAVAVTEALLESLSDSVILQFTNMDTKNVWTCTVHDFRRIAEPIQFAGYERQRLAYLSKMNHTRQGKGKMPRVNELIHIEHDPIVPKSKQMSLFG